MLKIIYGLAGSGKTTACFQYAKEQIKNGKSVVFIIPEGYSLAMERKVVQEFGAGFSGVVDVLSFERLASQIFARFGPITQDHLTPCTQQMLMQKVLLKLQGKLNLLASAVKQADFAETILTLVSEFHRYLITPEMLTEQAQNSPSMLSLKLQDIELIYRTYISEIANKATNPSTLLESFTRRIDELISINMNPFANTHFILDQFTSFTPQEYAVIERQMRHGEALITTLTCKTLEPSRLFAESTQTATTLFSLAEETGIQISPNKFIPGERTYADENITIFHANNPYGEVVSCAETISELEIPHSQISIIAHDSALYGGLIRSILPRYGIDIFIDDAPTALKDAEIQSTLSFLNVFVQNLSAPSILKFLKSESSQIHQKSINLLENYSIAAGLTQSHWLGKREITFIPNGFTQQHIEEIKRILAEELAPITNFASRFSGRKTASEIIDALLETLNPTNEILLETLAQFRLIFASELLTFKQFHTILRAGLQACDLTPLPQTANQAHFCSIDRYKGQSPRCLFILGTQEGAFPARHITEGILNDSDRTMLEKSGITLAMTATHRQLFEQQKVYTCLHSPIERLFIFHSAADFEGKPLPPSPVIAQLQAKYPNCTQKNNIFGQPLPPKNEYSNIPRSSKSATISALYTQTPTTSVSRVESFSRCQFAYFLRYGLRALPRDISKITAPSSGKILHAVIERFCKIGNFEDLTTIPEITHQVLEEELNETLRQTPRFSAFEKKIISTLQITLKNIAEFYKSTDFEPLGFESELPPLEITLDNGENITLRGRVDRIDICRTATGNFISVVDYKSSEKTIDEADVACGVQVQLPAYIHALCNAYSKKENAAFFPASMLYYKIDAPSVASTIVGESDSQDSIPQVWHEIQKKLRMRGIMLDVVAESKAFVYKNTATLEEINNLCQTALNQIKKQLNQISSGAISLNPYRRAGTTGANACDFCDYHSVCKFDTLKKGNEYNVVKK